MMAERRMFTQKIIDSDAFLDMPLSTQALYFHLNMRADDDGFVNNPKRIQRTIGASEDDLKLLFAKRFVIGFESGVLVIKHWRMHNTLRKDRYNPTQYQDEFALLDVKGNNAYTERLPELPEPKNESVATTWQPDGNQLEPEWKQNGSRMEPQYSIGKDSIGKVSIYNISDSNDSSECNATSNATVTQCNETDIDKDKEDKEIYISIVAYLNQRAGTNYRASSKKTKSCIHARLEEGFGLDDFKTVIDKKADEWIGTEYEQYLRPETLFGTKFEGYLNAKKSERRGNNGTAARDPEKPRIGHYI